MCNAFFYCQVILAPNTTTVYQNRDRADSISTQQNSMITFRLTNFCKQVELTELQMEIK